MTELAVIEAEVMEPLSEGKAKVLDKRIRQAGTRLANERDTLVDLLNEAAQGQIHVALGFPSWPAYVKDAVQIVVSDREDRKALAAFMSGKGMSNRAIASIVNVTEGTIRNDLSGAQDSAPEITGLDGKEYKRKPKDNNIIDTVVVDFPEQDEENGEPEPRTAADVINDFAENMDYLMPNVQAFSDILKDDAELFPKARKRLAQRFLNRLQGAIDDLTCVVDELMEG